MSWQFEQMSVNNYDLSVLENSVTPRKNLPAVKGHAYRSQEVSPVNFIRAKIFFFLSFL